MKRIGILHGRERTFPEAFCAAINASGLDIRAESIRIEDTRADMPREWDVLVDRISHEVPFYQLFLKQAALQGTRIINNPFWRIADDKYFGTCLAARLGIAIPRTMILPQREYVKDISPESLTNLSLVDWEGVASYLGMPCYLKPATGGGWKDVSKCRDIQELIGNYDQSGRQVMMVQEEIRWEAYARLLCIGRERVRIAPWDPTLPHPERYVKAAFTYSDELEALMIGQALLLNRALGYDMNTVEFAIRDGVPFAIDFTNSAPDFDSNSITPADFVWVVEAMAELAIARALEDGQPELPARWLDLL